MGKKSNTQVFDFPILIVNLNLQVLGANKQAVDCLNYAPEDSATIYLQELIPDLTEEKVNEIKKGQQEEKALPISLTTAEHENVTTELKVNSLYYKNKILLTLKFILPEFQEEYRIKQGFIEKIKQPVIKISREGILLAANSASKSLLASWKCEEGDLVPQFWQNFVQRTLDLEVNRKIEVKVAGRAILFSTISLLERDEIYLYGHDVTDLKDSPEDVEKLTNYDLLTGLPNWDLFMERLQQLVGEIKKDEQQNLIGVAFVDLDNFTKVNDSLGRKAGDKLLNKAAQRLKSCLEKIDILARLDGDEFGVIIKEQESIDNINHQVQRMLQEFSQPFILDVGQEEQKKFFITISVGVAFYPEDGTESEQLIKNAELAMHKVKEKGKDHHRFYSQAMNDEVLQEIKMETKLRQALKEDNFVLYYQPQIDIQTNQVCGLEALIRWQDPEMGLVSPGKFIPMAEKTGLIIPIGNWVLQTACEEIKNLHQQGFSDLKLGVNLSARQFQDNQLINKVAQALQKTSLKPQYLELELTESIIMDDVEGSVDRLFELKKQGVQFSIDDFGTGYSSLSYLKRFPIGTLKIDRSFVGEVPTNVDNTAIVKAIIDLAHNLNLNVVAEGAETVDQVDFLEENDCDEVQGFYYSRPLPKDELINFMEEG